MDANASSLQAYTTKTDMLWNPINYTLLQKGTTQVVSIQMHYEYSKPLQGDLAIMFSDAEISEFPPWTIPALLMVVALLATLGYKKLGRSLKS